MLLSTDMVSASAGGLEPQQQTFQNTLWFRSRQTGNRVAVVNLMGGPTGGYGYETYRQYFVDLAASWKEDYPNIQHYYAFQIWPKSCAMGINGSDNRLREVQRTLPKMFSGMSVISTLGVKPPGGCHFPAAGYAEFARFLHPMMQYDLYHRHVMGFNPPNLHRAFFTSAQRDELILEFDYHLLYGQSGLAALTFCDVPIEPFDGDC